MPEQALTVDLGSIADRDLSLLSQGLIGSEVLRIAAEIRALIAEGRAVCNLTVGDFDPKEYPAPGALITGIDRALRGGHTGYPPSNGMLELRQAAVKFLEREAGLVYPVESVLVAGGARPLIYASYKALVDPGDAVAFPVPSWNNNHYCYLTGAKAVPIAVDRASRFHPTAAAVRAVLGRIRMLALCTPLNPTGTSIAPEVLTEICRDLVAENRRREQSGERPVFLLFDMVYWSLEFDRVDPLTPPMLVPEVAPYTIMLDAISKSLASTGLRVGWAFGAPAVIKRMSDFLGHVGAWAPRAEQVATAEFISNAESFRVFRADMQRRLRERLELLHDEFSRLKAEGHAVESVKPEGTLYLSARFDLFGCTLEGVTIRTNEDLRKVLLNGAGLAVVPFQAFGLNEESGWVRISVGAVSMASVQQGMQRLRALLEKSR